MKCTICNKPITLMPSATARAEKFGGKASDYIALFTEHATCVANKRSDEAASLMKHVGKQREAEKVSFPLCQ